MTTMPNVASPAQLRALRNALVLHEAVEANACMRAQMTNSAALTTLGNKFGAKDMAWFLMTIGTVSSVVLVMIGGMIAPTFTLHNLGWFMVPMLFGVFMVPAVFLKGRYAALYTLIAVSLLTTGTIVYAIGFHTLFGH